VTLVGARAVTWADRVVEDVYHAPVITCDDEVIGVITAAFVDMSTINSLGEAAFGFPCQRASGRQPVSAL